MSLAKFWKLAGGAGVPKGVGTPVALGVPRTLVAPAAPTDPFLLIKPCGPGSPTGLHVQADKSRDTSFTLLSSKSDQSSLPFTSMVPLPPRLTCCPNWAMCADVNPRIYRVVHVSSLYDYISKLLIFWNALRHHFLMMLGEPRGSGTNFSSRRAKLTKSNISRLHIFCQRLDIRRMPHIRGSTSHDAFL